MSLSVFDQSGFGVRCEWGENGILQLAPASDVVIIVDVLSFSTCVEIAVSKGASVFPYQWNDESAREFAASVNAQLAGKRAEQPYSLSPASLLGVSSATRLVLPSPNGSTLSLMTGQTLTLVGCLRNSKAVAQAAMKHGRRIAVIPAGERWQDGSLRPAFEDLIAAGAVISNLTGSLSPEAKIALDAFEGAKPHLKKLLKDCASGRELIERGYGQDVELAAELDISDCVPTLINSAFINQSY